MLLAEANQWPEDAAAYFGSGDECHMNFHFPIMPRLFMAIHMEDRFPILDILAQTPQIPANCQWALFLRNHDELTLEMVTDEERDYMYRAYAHDSEMRINLGIRRRLAPLVGNDRRKMELLNGLLFSLPGTPVLYYGDEIGMGDNVYLGDRNGVRTPMQWSADRNAGFSRANPQRLILPIIIDPEYHYEAINVEAQQNNPNSLLWWTKRLIALRKQFQAFGRGTMEFLTPANYRVLAFVASYPTPDARETTRRCWWSPTCRASRSTSSWTCRSGRGCGPLELFGHTEFPPIGELPYLLTLAGLRLLLVLARAATVGRAAKKQAAAYVPPRARRRERAQPARRRGAAALEDALGDFLATRRWFGGRAFRVTAVRIEESVGPGRHVRAGRARRVRGPRARRYVLPRRRGDRGRDARAARDHRRRCACPDGTRRSSTRWRTARRRARCWPRSSARRARPATGGTVEATPFADLEVPRGRAAQHQRPARRGRHPLRRSLPAEDVPPPRGGREPGAGARALHECARAGPDARRRRRDRVPAARAEPSTLAVLQAYVPNEGDRLGARARGAASLLRARAHAPPRGCGARRGPARAARAGRDEPPRPPRVTSSAPTWIWRRCSGRRTAEMHLALALERRRPELRARAVLRRSTAARSTSRCGTWSARRCGCCASASAACPPTARRWRAACSTGRSSC